MQQKRQHAPHRSVPYGLHKCVIDHVLILMDREEKALVPMEREWCYSMLQIYSPIHLRTKTYRGIWMMRASTAWAILSGCCPIFEAYAGIHRIIFKVRPRLLECKDSWGNC